MNYHPTKAISLRTLLILSVGIAVCISSAYRWLSTPNYSESAWITDANVLSELANSNHLYVSSCTIDLEHGELLNEVLQKLHRDSPDLSEIKISCQMSDLSQFVRTFNNAHRVIACWPELSVENSMDLCRIFPNASELSLEDCRLCADVLSRFQILKLRKLELSGPVDPAYFDVAEIAAAFSKNRLAPELVLAFGRQIHIDEFACDTLESIDLWRQECNFDEICNLVTRSPNLHSISYPFSVEEEEIFRQKFPLVAIN